MLRIDHPHLISPEGVAILFPGEKATRSDLPITAVFNVPITNFMPFGPILFVDTTILPGTVALNAFGHGIQLLPRTLSIDFKEFSWETAAPIVLSATNKPPSERLKPHPQDWQGR